MPRLEVGNGEGGRNKMFNGLCTIWNVALGHLANSAQLEIAAMKLRVLSGKTSWKNKHEADFKTLAVTRTREYQFSTAFFM